MCREEGFEWILGGSLAAQGFGRVFVGFSFPDWSNSRLIIGPFLSGPLVFAFPGSACDLRSHPRLERMATHIGVPVLRFGHLWPISKKRR